MSESKEFLMSGQTVRGFNVLRFQDRYIEILTGLSVDSL